MDKHRNDDRKKPAENALRGRGDTDIGKRCDKTLPINRIVYRIDEIRRFGTIDKIVDTDETRTDIDCLTVLYKILQPYVRTG